MTWLWIVLAILLLVTLFVILTYNGLVGGRNRTQEAWSQIDVELKRRHDLVPNLVNAVQGYVSHERGTLEAVTAARTEAVAAGASADPARIGAAETQLSTALRSLFAVAESYPDLKAVATFTELQQQLESTENKIEYARRYYNGSARDFNTTIQQLPTVLVAGPAGFRAFAYFQADEADRGVPAVGFSAAPPQLPPSPTGEPPATPAPPA